MKKPFNIKRNGKQKYLSPAIIDYVDSQRVSAYEPFYITLERVLGLSEGKKFEEFKKRNVV